MPCSPVGTSSLKQCRKCSYGKDHARVLREETDLDRLGEDLMRVVSETLQLEHVSSPIS
jgi:hypothetical protein